MDEQFWINWLKIAALAVVGFGLMLAAASHPASAVPTMMLADLLVWPFDGNPAAPDQMTRLLSAISGGVMAGWGEMLWMTAAWVLPRQPEIGRRIILVSVVAWFVVDSAGSFVAGVPLNDLGNIVFLAAFLVPLWALSRAGSNKALA